MISAVVGVALAVAITPAGAVTTRLTWRTPISMGGVTSGTLGSATLGAPTISCWAPGDCEAVGTYVDTTNDEVLYWDAEQAGLWGVATTLGQAPSNASSPATLTVDAVSCSAHGDCAVAGTYASTVTGASVIFVSTQVSGVWGAVTALPGIAGLDTGNQEQVGALQCVGAGSCLLAGTFVSASGATSVFTSSSAGATWSHAVALPEPADAGSPSFAAVGGIWCPSAGACTLVGTYADTSGEYQVLVDTEVSGAWSTPAAVSALEALNSYYAQGTTVWCASPGTCEIGGVYTDAGGATQGFDASTAGGSVTSAGAIPGLGALNASGAAGVDAVSCTVPGSCIIGGSYSSSGSNQDAFVESVVGGTPQAATALPGWASLNSDTGAASGAVTQAACGASACAVAGTYTDASGNTQVFGDTESAGTWHTVGAVAGAPPSATSGDSSVLAFACDTSLACDLAASGTTSTGGQEAYEVSGGPTSWTWGQLFDPSSAVHESANAGSGDLTCWVRGACAAVGFYAASATSELPWIDVETSGVWGAATAIPLSTADKSVVPASVACSDASDCVVVVDVADTVVDAQQSGTTPEVLVETAGTWGTLSAITIKNGSYPVVTPLAASALCAGGACHVLATVSLARSHSGSLDGYEVAVATVQGASPSAYAPIDVYASAKGSPGYLQSAVWTCSSATQCLEVDGQSTYSNAAVASASVVHRFAGGRWTTVARLTGPRRKEGTSSNPYSVSDNVLTSASCASSGQCELVGFTTQASGPVTVAYAMSLTGGTLSKPLVLAGYSTAAKSDNTARSVQCVGASCVVLGETSGALPASREVMVVSALKGSATAAIARTVLPPNSFFDRVACAGARSCLMTLQSYSLTSGGISWDYLTLQGSRLSGPVLLPGAAAGATNVVGPAAPTGGAFELLVDEGSNSSHPFVLQS